MKKVFDVAIIGFGPKGLYTFERLLAEIAKAEPIKTYNIHLFNKTPYFGSGDIYRSDQPDYLKMNIINKNINAWSLQNPPPIAKHPLTFTNWKRLKDKLKQENIDDEYSSRAEVGRYLEHTFSSLLDNLPSNVAVFKYVGTVYEIEKGLNGYKIKFKRNDLIHKIVICQKIMLSTGHPTQVNSTHPTRSINFVYPVTEKLSKVTTQSSVAVKGMGLTFIDTVLGLTEGRGGTFQKLPEGRLVYHPCNKEPKIIYPFSLSAVPMIPRDGRKQVDKNENSYLKIYWLSKGNNKKYSFKNELLPEIEKDFTLNFYNALFQRFNLTPLSCFDDYIENQKRIKSFHKKYPNQSKFNFKQFLNPFQSINSSDWNEVIKQYMIEMLNRVQESPINPLIAASTTWIQLSEVFNEIYSFGGLESSAQQDFDKNFAGVLNRISYGPPLINYQKLVALQNAGLINYSLAKNPTLQYKEGSIIIENYITKKQVVCDYLIDARIPKIDVQKDSLFQSILKHNMAESFANLSSSKSYRPGNIAINSDGNLIHKNRINSNIAVYGTPTEGATYDNDTLDRSRNNFASKWAKNVVTT